MSGPEIVREAELLRTRLQLAHRLRWVRTDLYGEAGQPALARVLGVSPQTWAAYEQGATIPAEVLLHFIALTSTSTSWLLHGEGRPYEALSLGCSPGSSPCWDWDLDPDPRPSSAADATRLRDWSRLVDDDEPGSSRSLIGHPPRRRREDRLP